MSHDLWRHKQQVTILFHSISWNPLPVRVMKQVSCLRCATRLTVVTSCLTRNTQDAWWCPVVLENPDTQFYTQPSWTVPGTSEVVGEMKNNDVVLWNILLVDICLKGLHTERKRIFRFCLANARQKLGFKTSICCWTVALRLLQSVLSFQTCFLK
jgi:hypothetical protein